MNSFYHLPKWIQWSVTIILLALSLLAVTLCFAGKQLLTGYLLMLLIIPLLQFCLTPLFRLLGAYHYVSPMLLVFGPNDQKYDLHSGTSFDYLFVMRGTPAGHAARRKLLCFFIEGLLQICEEIESGERPATIEVSGTSYFISENMARKLGFELSGRNLFLTINLWFNVIDLTWMYSYAQGKLSFPPLSKACSIKTSGSRLLEHKEELRSIIDRISR